MDKSTFLREYVISAVAGSAVGRGSLKPHEIVQDAIDSWNAISDATGAVDEKPTKVKKGE